MGEFMSRFGDALERYEAQKSPLMSAIYQASTGQSPLDRTSQQQQPGQPNQPGRYKRPSTQTPGVPLDPHPTKTPVPLNPDAGTVDLGLMGGGVDPALLNKKPSVGSGVAGDGGSPWPNDTLNGGGYDAGPTYSNIDGMGGVFSTISAPPPTGSSSSTITYPGYPGDQGSEGGDTPYDPYDGYGDNMARGGHAGSSMTARVAESGPEMAGGKIVTNPSIVSLEKGDSVIPLTPRAGNKFQPDLLEGHLAAPKPQGMQYSRYKSYGQGRGLMR